MALNIGSLLDEALSEFLLRLRICIAQKLSESGELNSESAMSYAGMLAKEETKLDALYGRGSQVGLTVTDHALKVADVVRGFSLRLEGVRGVRFKEGRTYSAATRERMKTHIENLDTSMGHMKAVRDEMQAMYDESEPKPKAASLDDADQTLLRILKLRTETSALIN